MIEMSNSLVWPLPNPRGLSKTEIEARFGGWETWHYDFIFEDTGDSLEGRNKRALWRYNHFIPALVDAVRGLQGKTILDLGSNSGFWSIQAALMGAEVVGVEGRKDLVDQARLVAEITGVNNVDFLHEDYWEIGQRLKGRQFDVVLNLGILYHLPDPYHALAHLMPFIGSTTVIDTTVFKSDNSVVQINWEEPDGIQQATRSGVVAIPSASALELMLRDLRFKRIQQIPVDHDSPDCPDDYREGWRNTWIAQK